MNKNIRTLCGVVVSTGRMMKTVKVRTAKQVYNDFLRKHFLTYENHLVSDPNSSLREGDVVRISNGWRASRQIKHIATEIVKPWGSPVEERPKLMSLEEATELKMKKRAAKLERRAQRREQGLAGQAKPERKPRKRRLGVRVNTAKSRKGKRALS